MEFITSTKRLLFGLLDLRYRTIWYRKRTIEFYRRFIKPGNLVFDIGSHIGNRTEIFLQLGARVIAVEPQKAAVTTLKKRFIDNRNLVIIQKAVSNKNGWAQLSICDEATALSTMSDRWRNEGRFANDYHWKSIERVRTVTLDELIHRWGNPVFCKIDVEGFELPVLQGLSIPIPLVSFEFTVEFLADVPKCITHLSSIGLPQFNCSIGETMQMIFPHWVSADKLYRRLKSFKEENLWGDIYVHFQKNSDKNLPNSIEDFKDSLRKTV